MKLSSIYFYGLTIIFLVFGALLAPKDSVTGFFGVVFLWGLFGLIFGFLVSWIYKLYVRTTRTKSLSSD